MDTNTLAISPWRKKERPEREHILVVLRIAH